MIVILKTREKFQGDDTAIRQGKDYASARERRIPPQGIRNKGDFAVALSVPHPKWKGCQKYQARAQKSTRRRNSDRSKIRAYDTADVSV
jgi:hypothetical protein